MNRPQLTGIVRMPLSEIQNGQHRDASDEGEGLGGGRDHEKKKTNPFQWLGSKERSSLANNTTTSGRFHDNGIVDTRRHKKAHCIDAAAASNSGPLTAVAAPRIVRSVTHGASSYGSVVDVADDPEASYWRKVRDEIMSWSMAFF